MVNTIDIILNTVCSRYNLTREEIAVKKGRRQLMNTVAAKQEAAYLLHLFTEMKQMEIAVVLGYPGKQIASHCIRQAKRIEAGNKSYQAELQEVKRTIKALLLESEPEIITAPVQIITETFTPTINKKRKYYFKTADEEYYALDDRKKLDITSKPYPVKTIEVVDHTLNHKKYINCNGEAAKILRFIYNRNGLADAKCILAYDDLHFTLEFSTVIDNREMLLIMGTQFTPEWNLSIQESDTSSIENPEYLPILPEPQPFLPLDEFENLNELTEPDTFLSLPEPPQYLGLENRESILNFDETEELFSMDDFEKQLFLMP